VRASFVRLRRLRIDPTRLDRIAAALLAIAAELQVWLGGIATHHRLAAGLVAAALTVSVMVRRAYPLGAGVAAAALTSTQVGVWGDPQVIGASIAELCALYGLTVWTSQRRFLLGTVAVTAAVLAAAAGPHTTLSSTAFVLLVVLAVMLLVRRVVGDRERRVELAERERDLAAREAVAGERARIARELHDVVAHSVSVIVVQAQAGPRLLAEPAQVRDVFHSIETTGREALDELRRLLGVLRARDEQLPVGPQPGLDALQPLIQQLREAGLRVELRVEGEPVRLPPGIDLSAYRIVQEALTNTLKHAGPAEAEVIVRYHHSTLELEILDNGTGAPARVNGSGHGLVGMRERVALYGGSLEAGARNGHGFGVRARLPLVAETTG
jgi:signal transduction histidine kinase